MAWIMDTLSMHIGHSVPAAVTGKPVNVGGSQGRTEATGRGVMLTTLEALKQLEMPALGASVAVQGYGNVGYYAARLLAERGCNVVAVSDSTSGVHNPKGLDFDRLARARKEHGTVGAARDGDRITNAELLELPVTVLVPAALENQITRANAPRLKARVVAEGANGPTTPEADEILFGKGVLLVPDILANAGGVTVSYFEWVQDLQSYFWGEDQINERLESIMTNAYQRVAEVAKSERINMRTAAYMLAVKVVADATRSRGIYP
jgi:glutamate dehydrogenase (NAD(P)+)